MGALNLITPEKRKQAAEAGTRDAERVRVYEKIRQGIWSYNGVFHLVDSWNERSGGRQVFKFKLVAVEGDEDFSKPPDIWPERRRIIPTEVKLEVWKRDGGKCRECGTTDELHFDHIVPVAKGGTSLVAENIQLLCARLNLPVHSEGYRMGNNGLAGLHNLLKMLEFHDCCGGPQELRGCAMRNQAFGQRTAGSSISSGS